MAMRMIKSLTPFIPNTISRMKNENAIQFILSALLKIVPAFVNRWLDEQKKLAGVPSDSPV